MYNFTKLDKHLQNLSKLDRIIIIVDEVSKMGLNERKKASNYIDIAIGYYNEYLNYESNPKEEIKDAIAKCYCSKIQIMMHDVKQIDFDALNDYRSFVNRNGKKMTQAYMEYLLTVLYTSIGQNSNAAQAGLRAIEHIEENDLPDSMKFLYSNLGLALERSNQFEEAERFLLMGLSINNKVDLVVEGKLLLHLGNLYSKQGKIDKALDCYFQSKEFTIKPDYSGLIVVNMNIGKMYSEIGNREKAVKFLQENASLKEWKQLDKFGISCFVTSLSTLIIYALYDRDDSTMDKYLKILKLVSTHQKNPYITSLYLKRRANYLQLTGNQEGAEKSYLEALNHIREHGTKEQIIALTDEVADFFMSLEKIDIAEEILLHNIELFKDDTSYFYITKTYSFYYKILKSQERYKEALDIAEKIRELESIIQKSELEKKVKTLEQEIANDKRKLVERDRRISSINRKLESSTESGFIGVSRKIKAVLSKVEMAAQHSDINVLILGESGTGKQIIADMIHKNSKRKDGTLCEVNCSAIPEGMAESEFFGYKKGAFTGAVKDNPGFLKEADSGTLFLDEIGDMPVSLQAKLLKVLENKNFTPLGSNKPETTDFRVICATHRNLEELISSGDFRLDFYNRINTFIIEIPPLRERHSDIAVIAEYYLDKYCTRMGIIKPDISEEAMEMIKSYSYPGNVRELRNIIERATLFLRNGLNLLNALSNSGLKSDNEYAKVQINESALISTDKLNLEDLELMAIKKALELSGNKKSKAAAMLGITPSAMTRRLQKFNL